MSQNSNSKRFNYHQLGFTLIELVVVIVILGILAATALPKFINIGLDGRIATLNQVSASMKSAMNLAYAKCMIVNGCVGTLGGGSSVMGPNGVNGIMYYGYPTGLSRVPGFFGIKDWLDVQGGLTLVEMSTNISEVRVDSAADPTNCKVRYYEAASLGSTPTVVITSSGC